MRVFFSNQDRNTYLGFMKEQLDDHKVEVWAWCLMTNHVHLIAVPDSEDRLAKAAGRTSATPAWSTFVGKSVAIFFKAGSIRA